LSFFCCSRVVNPVRTHTAQLLGVDLLDVAAETIDGQGRKPLSGSSACLFLLQPLGQHVQERILIAYALEAEYARIFAMPSTSFGDDPERIELKIEFILEEADCCFPADASFLVGYRGSGEQPSTRITGEKNYDFMHGNLLLCHCG